MVVAVTVVAVAHEGMSSFATLTAVVHRPSVGKLVVDELIPCIVGVARAPHIVCARIVAEIILQRRNHIGRRSARGTWRVVHLHRNATILHQIGNRPFGGISRSIVISIGHIIPVDGRILRNALHGHLSIVLPVRGASVAGNVRLHTPHRAYAVVVHDLRHRRCHTSRHASLSRIEELRAINVIRIALVPLAREKRRNGGMRRSAPWRLLSTRLQPADGIAIAVEPPLHVRRQAVASESAPVGITQNGRHAVVAGSNHEALVVAHVKYEVVSLHGQHAILHGCMTERPLRQRLSFRSKEVPCILQRLFTADGIGESTIVAHTTAEEEP